MSHPSHGRPPYPRPPMPDESPTERLPVQSPRRPTAQYPLDDPYDRYDGYDDDGRAHDGWADYQEPAEPVADRRRLPADNRPRRRGQAFALLVLVCAIGTSVLLGMLVYQALAAVDSTSGDPLAGLDSRLATLGAVAVGALVVFVLALVALVVARPKLLAFLGLLAAVLLPVGGVLVGGWYGGQVLSQRVESSVSAAGSAVGPAVDNVVRELESRGIDIGPLRDLLPG